MNHYQSSLDTYENCLLISRISMQHSFCEYGPRITNSKRKFASVYLCSEISLASSLKKNFIINVFQKLTLTLFWNSPFCRINKFSNSKPIGMNHPLDELLQKTSVTEQEESPLAICACLSFCLVSNVQRCQVIAQNNHSSSAKIYTSTPHHQCSPYEQVIIYHPHA